MKLSVIVPCFNEESVIRETHRRLTHVLNGLRIGAEIIYVDDGSSDATAEILEKLCLSDSFVRVLRLSRNFGQQVAITAGLEYSTGDAMVVIDADLQDPPEVIPEMLERWRGGADVVYAVRQERLGESFLKKVTAKAFYRLMHAASGVPMALDSGDFRLMDRRVVSALLLMSETDRFLRGMVHWVGFKSEVVHYVRQPRVAGQSKYGLSQMLHLATAGLLSFSMAPLRLASVFGLFACSVALMAACLAMYLQISGKFPLSIWVGVSIAVLFVIGMQFLCMGVLGEYIGRIHQETKRRPLYFLSKQLGFRQQGVGTHVPERLESGFEIENRE